MSDLRTALKRAEGTTSRRNAARLYNDIEYELALGEHPSSRQAAGEATLAALRERFPSLQDDARQVTTPPALSRRASNGLHEGRSRRGSSSPPRGRAGARAARPAAARTASRAAATGRTPAGQGPTATSVRDAAIGTAAAGAGWAADTSWGSLVLEIFLGGVLLSIGYLLLTNAKGPAELVTGASNLVTAVVSPTIDPLNPPKGL